MYNANPSPEELYEWQMTAIKRNAILPRQIEIKQKYATIICGDEECNHIFTRKLLPHRNDPVFVCPRCNSRIYLPISW